MSSANGLAPRTALDNFSKDYEGISVSEVTNQAIVSIAIPTENDKSFAAAVKKSYKAERPAIGQFTQSKTDNARFLGLQKDQLFMLFDYDSDRAVEQVNKAINGSKQLTYLSDQSDSWITLRVSGENCREALERICPLDIHPLAFPIGSVSRTSMEHMAAIIVREDENSFLLLSLRSFAQSFLHAITTSIDNIS